MPQRRRPRQAPPRSSGRRTTLLSVSTPTAIVDAPRRAEERSLTTPDLPRRICVVALSLLLLPSIAFPSARQRHRATPPFHAEMMGARRLGTLCPGRRGGKGPPPAAEERVAPRRKSLCLWRGGRACLPVGRESVVRPRAFSGAMFSAMRAPQTSHLPNGSPWLAAGVHRGRQWARCLPLSLCQNCCAATERSNAMATATTTARMSRTVASALLRLTITVRSR